MERNRKNDVNNVRKSEIHSTKLTHGLLVWLAQQISPYSIKSWHTGTRRKFFCPFQERTPARLEKTWVRHFK